MIAVFTSHLACAFAASVSRLALVAGCLTLAACIDQTDHNYAQFDFPTGPTGNTEGYCPPYTSSTVYRPRGKQFLVSPQNNWTEIISNATPDSEILLQDGTYYLDIHSVVVPDEVTIRSLSEDRNAVVIEGRGYSFTSEGLMLAGNNISIADITITGMRDHAIAIKPESGAQYAPHIYNVNLSDIGTQHVKLSPGGTRDGLVACSVIGYSQGAAVGDYNGAIDLHGAVDWVIRDNLIYNIYGDGSGCIVYENCGSVLNGPAILVWRNANGTITERNLLIDNHSNISYREGHRGGVIRNNFIFQSKAGDAGIELFDTVDIEVDNNTVILAGSYRGGIEYRQSKNLFIGNNTTSTTPWNRGGNLHVSLSNNSLARVDRNTCRQVNEYLNLESSIYQTDC